MKQTAHSEETKAKLAQALRRLMRQKPFDSITVSELTRAADVDRKTFYYHFEELPALLHWMFARETTRLLESFGSSRDLNTLLNLVMDYLEEDDYFIRSAYDGIGREGLKRFFYADFIGIFSELIAERAASENCEIEPDYAAFLANFFAEAAAGLILDWVHDKASIDRDRAVAYFNRLLSAAVTGVTGGCPTDTSGLSSLTPNESRVKVSGNPSP